MKKSLYYILILVLAITALPLSDSAFSDYTYAAAEEEENYTTDDIAIPDDEIPLIITEDEVTGQSIIEDKIRDDNIEKMILREEEPEEPANTSPAPIQKTDLITNPYKGYSYSRLKKEIDKLQIQYPDLIEAESIGKSVGGRDIPLVRLGNGEKKILIIGSEHAREYATTSLIMRAIDEYSKAYVLNKKIDGTNVRNVLDKVTFYFIPMLNVDGVQLILGKATAKDIKIVQKHVGKKYFKRHRSLWKANLRGVDLNRNYPFRWSSGYTTRHRGHMNFKGRTQSSEPEIRAVVSLCASNRFAYMLTMHSRGQVIYWKDRFNDVVPGAAALASKVRSVTKYRLMPTSGWNSCAGESAKWFRAMYNKPALTVEITPYYMPYGKALQKKNFDKIIWKRAGSLFLKTALTTTPTDRYKIFFNSGNGKIDKRYKEITTGKTYGILPKARRKGYKFLGWYTYAGIKISSTSVVTQQMNTVLYAKYKKK